MYQCIAFCIFILIGLSVNAQTTVNVRGKVTNLAGKGISNATVTLVRQGLKATSGVDGAYTIAGTVAVLPAILPKTEKISLSNGVLGLTLSNPSPVKVEIFDVQGNLVKKEQLRSVAAGEYRLNVEKNFQAANLLVIKASIGNRVMSFRYLPLNNGKYTVNLAGDYTTPVNGGFAKMAAVVDTVRTSAANYTSKSMTITSYDQELNISLDTAGGAKPSAGCGKTTTLKGEQRLSVTVGSQTREYILRLPDDYDVNTPYKLHFSIHCLGGTAKGVANQSGYEYYGIWKYANPTGQKGTTIFCSPEGLVSTLSGSALGWDNKSGVDVEFIRTLVKKFESELCIDQSRIFSEGFSMGGSMSYALACAMPDTFKAICMHSGGPMSGCDQSHRGPVSMFITHGINDNACPYPSSGVGQLKDLASRDGCTALDIPSICKPTDNSGANPACASYDGCKTGFFCRACIFVGGHDYTAGGGASKTWIDDSTWNFFKQF